MHQQTRRSLVGLFLAFSLAAVTASAQPYAYVTSGAGQSVTIINRATNRPSAFITVAGAPSGAAVTPDGAYLYVACASANNVAVISTATNAIVAHITVGLKPMVVAITPNGSSAYVVNQGANTVSVINT